MKPMLIAVLLAVFGSAPASKVAHLGVTTVPVDESLGAQLKLPPGVGLLVVQVDADSPAAKTLQKNDVLHKLGDQILVNYEQLQVLLHLQKAGDTVAFTVIRAGESRKCGVRLGERTEESISRLLTVPGDLSRAVETVVGIAGGDVARLLPHITFTSTCATTQESSSQVCVNTNERGTFTLTCIDGKKRFTAVSSGGKTLFDGPVNTAEERAKLSAALKKELAALEKSDKSAKTK